MWVQIWHDLSSARAPRPPARPRVLSVSDLARDNRHADTSRARVCSRPRSRVRGSGWASSRSAAVACGFFFTWHTCTIIDYHNSINQTVTCPLLFAGKASVEASNTKTLRFCTGDDGASSLFRAHFTADDTPSNTHTHTHRLARWRLCVLGPSARIASPSRPRDPPRPRASLPSIVVVSPIAPRKHWCR